MNVLEQKTCAVKFAYCAVRHLFECKTDTSLSVIHRFFPNRYVEPGPHVHFDTITDIYDIGNRFHMPLIMNTAINLFANRIKFCKKLPSKRSVEVSKAPGKRSAA